MIDDWKTKAKYHFVSSVGLWSLMLTMMQYMNDEGSCNVSYIIFTVIFGKKGSRERPFVYLRMGSFTFFLQSYAHLWHNLFEEGHVLDINCLRLQFKGEDSNVGPEIIDLC